MRQTTAGMLAVALLVASMDLVVVITRRLDREPAGVAAAERPPRTSAPVPTSLPSTTAAPATTTLPPTTSPPPSTPAPPSPTTSETTAAPSPANEPALTAQHSSGPWTVGPLRGVGAWIDVYDWTNELTNGQPSVLPPDIDRMADLGVQTIYIQTAHRRSAADVIEPDRLDELIDRAHARDMAVVAWYLPTLEDVEVDLRRLLAAARLPIDGLGVDIESRDVADPAERTRRLLDLSLRLRQAVGDRAIAAITPSAVHLQVINPGFWPGFPWPELAATYDAILPMAYWSIRRTEWRSGERYIGENIDRIRASTGRPDVLIHPIGGIADGTTEADVQGMVRAIATRGAMGGSLYDWATANPALWEAMRPLHAR